MAIVLNYDALLRQAHITAHDYMLHAKANIDDIFGAGYAKAHPELVAACMKAASDDFNTALIGKEIGEALDAIADALSAVTSGTAS